MDKKKLSVVIITKNEAHNIRDCLNSVSFADEIVVFDSGSSDNTVAICQEYTDKVIVTDDWPGYGVQKQRAINHATGVWILCLDADERLSAELQEEVKSTLQNTHYIAFYMSFISSYCGRKIYFGDWKNESHIRLFQKDQATISADIVHEDLVFFDPNAKEKISKFKHPVYHHPFRDLDMVLDKVNRYSKIGAIKKYNHQKKASIFTAVFRGLWTFIRGYFLKLGFLDGREGFMLAVSNAEGTYYRYLKLVMMNAK